MAALFIEGWDKYGGVNSNTAGVAALLTAGEWSTASGITIVTGLSATGFAVLVGSADSLVKTLPATVGRLIGGFRVSTTLGAASGVQLLDAATAQCSVRIDVAGTISVRNGALAGTALATSAASITANTTHYIEFDITLGNAGAGLYQVWLDGVSVLSGTGDTTATANNTVNGFSLISLTGNLASFDDLYMFDTSGSTNNAVLLTSPRVETQFPTSDGAVQFTVGASILGSSLSRGGSNFNTGANYLYVRPLTPTVNCTINSIGLLPGVTNGVMQLRPILYADTAGVPGTLMSAGSTVVGITSGTIVTMPLTTPQSLVAGTRYWLGVMTDINVPSAYAGQDTSLVGRFVVSTFASGAPGTMPATTGAQNTAVIFGNISGVAGNFYEAAQNPPQGNFSYVYDAVVGHEDLYNFPALAAPSPTIHAVAVKGSIAKSDSGAKTLTMRSKSGATDSAGSASSLAPSTAYAWMTSLFPVDPATSAAWSLAALNAAQAGIRVET